MRRDIHADPAFGVEVYHFQGIVQAFPSHFHDYYLFGLVERGQRALICGGRAWAIGPGDVLLFDPGESHRCIQTDGGTLDYRGFCLSRESALGLTEQVTGRRVLPRFAPKVVHGQPDLAQLLRELHQLFTHHGAPLDKRELLLLTFSALLARCRCPLPVPRSRRQEIDRVCRFLEHHYDSPVRLDQLAGLAGLSTSALVRAFTKERGITPYRYLEAVRIDHAQRLLRAGYSLSQTALQTGFTDQSHLGRHFTRITGVTPGVYRDGAVPRRPSKEEEP